MAEIGVDILKCKRILEYNQLIGFPTETVYGLAGNALSVEAVSKIFETKNRPTFDPLICHTNSIAQIEKYVTEIPTMGYDLLTKFAPGPITLLLKRKNLIPDLVTSGLEHVAFRIPNHPIALELLKHIDFPLAAPSANPFGYISPTSAAHVNTQLGNFISYILNGGKCSVGIESTIVGFENNKAHIYRLGGIDLAAIEHITGRTIVQQSTSKPSAAGMLESHYAPRKKIYVGHIDNLIEKYKNHKIGVLSFSKKYNFCQNLQLSENKSETEAAQNLFGHLRSLDESDCEIIIAEYITEKGLGKAVNDRLKRAST